MADERMTPSEAGRALGALGASLGGKARAAKLSRSERQDIASKAGRQRVENAKPQWNRAERRKLIAQYSRSAEAVEFFQRLPDSDVDALRFRWMREKTVDHLRAITPVFDTELPKAASAALAKAEGQVNG